MSVIKCFRFGTYSPYFFTENYTITLSTLRRNQTIKFSDLLFAGVDNSYIYISGKKNQLYETIISLPVNTKILVLTSKERQLILNCGILDNNITVYSLEEHFPFLCNVVYCSDSAINFRILNKYVDLLKKAQIQFSYLHDFYKSFNKKIVKKIKNISVFDRNFYFVPAYPYQEVFMFKENRSDRIVFALDFNSMYASVMSHDYPDPSALEHTVLNKFYSQTDKLEVGMYRVVLSGPDKFIRKYHSIRYVSLLTSYPFEMNTNDSIETILTNRELEYYCMHFSSVFLKEGFCSKTTIRHPLIRNRNRLYQQRRHYINNNNEMLAGFNKFLLTMLHSISNTRADGSCTFNSFENLQKFLDKFGISCPKNMNYLDYLLKINRNRFELKNKLFSMDLKYPDFMKNNSNIYSLYSFVISDARIKMMETIESLLMFPNCEICYANVDSLHVSINKIHENDFKQYLDSLNIVGTDLGQLKIENIAQHGIWMFPGRYWLYNDEKIIQFKNINLNTRQMHNDHISLYRKIIWATKIDKFSVPQSYTFRFSETHNLRKQLVGNYFYRLTVEQINNFNDTYTYAKFKKNTSKIFDEEIKVIKNKFRISF